MKRIVLSFATVMVLLIAMACQNPVQDTVQDPGVITVDVTGVTLDSSAAISLEVGDTATLAVTVVPDNADSGLTWSSSSTSVATVDSSGKVTAVSAGTATIRVASAIDPSIKDESTVNVFNSITPLSGFSLYNQPDVGEGTTSVISGLYDDKLYITNTSTDGTVNSSTFTKNTIVYFDTSFTGDFRIQARILIEDQVNSSSNRGVLLGALEQTAAGEFGGAAKYAFIMKRTRGDIRSYYYKGDGSRGAGSPNIASDAALDEYIYEVARDSDSITFTVMNSNTGVVIETNDILFGATSNDISADLQGPVALYPAILANGATAVVSNIKIWSGAAGSETLEFETTEVSGSPVYVNSVTVNGPQLNADASFDYQNSLAGAQADTIQLTADVTPAQADDTSVAWRSSDESIATVDAGGLVTVLAAGDVTITVTTNDNSFTDTYAMHITAADVLVGSLAISGETELMEGLTTTLTTAALPADASDQTVTWSVANGTGQATIDSVTGVVTAVAAGTVTITATANDAGGVTETHDMTITPAVSTVFEWIAGVSSDFDADTTPATVDGYTIVDRSGTTAGTSTGIALGNGRFNIGTSHNDNGAGGGTLLATAADVMVPDGEFNFAQAVTVTIGYSSISGTGFNVYVNNNTTSSGNSVLGGGSKLSANEDLTLAEGTATFSIDPAAYAGTNDPGSLNNAFIQLRADSSTSVLITSIMITYD